MEKYISFDLLKLKQRFKEMKLLKLVMFMTLSVFAKMQLDAQCPITYSSVKLCEGSPIAFTGNLTGTNHNWDFNGEGTNTTSGSPKFTFNTPGVKVVKYTVTLPNGTTCNSQVTFTVFSKPQSSMTITTLDTQCFKGNLFCYTDNSNNPNGAKIDSIYYILDDGQSFVFPKPTMPNTFCFSIINPQGGNFSVQQFVKDENGCESQLLLKNDITVRSRIGASFISNNPIKCDSVEVTVTNTTLINQSLVKSIVWHWGDGTTETGWGPVKKHWYYKPGPNGGAFPGKVVVTTNDGCADSFSSNAIATVFSANVRIVADRDSVCISDPEINFSIKDTLIGVTQFLWNFGNPPSGTANFNNKSLNASHRAWGLGPYKISFTYRHPICGNRTIYDTIEVVGPVSAIEIPFNRIEEYQTFQCPAYLLEEVQTKNFSTFYHNDNKRFNDDSSYIVILDTVSSKTGTYTNYDSLMDLHGKRMIDVYDPTFDVGDYILFFQNSYEAYIKSIANNKSYIVSYKLVHTFKPNQTAKDYIPANERLISDCVWRVWDFGDEYAAKCTTYTRFNINTNINCNFSSDSLPKHRYRSWDQIMISDFKNAPMVDAIFIDSNRLCKRQLVYPSDFSYIIEDSLVTVPWSDLDTLLANVNPQYKKIKPKHFLAEKGFRGKGRRFVIQDVDIKFLAGDTVYIGDKDGAITNTYYGPATINVKKDQMVILNSPYDSITWLFTVTVKKDTIPIPMYDLRIANGENPKVVGLYAVPHFGVRNFDYTVNWKRWVDLYYARIPQCNNIRLWHKDTCHAMQCENVAVKPVSMLHANAGGVGSGLLKESVECLGSANNSYGITFVLNDLKPGCTFSDVQLNYDTFCGGNNWVSLSTGLIPGNRPPGLPYMGYQLQGNPPSRYSKQFTAADVCSPDQCITVGVIVGNGVDKTGKKPLCADTQYYDRFACFPLIDPRFEIIKPVVPQGKFMKICKWDPVIARNVPGNKTNVADLQTIRWIFETNNASPTFANIYQDEILETYSNFKKLAKPIMLPSSKVPLKDGILKINIDTLTNGVIVRDTIFKYKYDYKYYTLDSNILYNLLVVDRTERHPVQIPCTNIWQNFDPFADVTKRPTGVDTIRRDTFITARILKWDTFADVSAVWDQIKKQAEDLGFDPFAISGSQFAKMIWNNKGIPGQPSTGALGCLDTNGFGKQIKFKTIAKTEKVILDSATYIQSITKGVPPAKDVVVYKLAALDAAGFTIKDFVTHYTGTTRTDSIEANIEWRRPMHFRDSIVKPLDSFKLTANGPKINSYKFIPKYNGYYNLTVSTSDNSGKCGDIVAKALVAGFGMDLEYLDSIICQDEVNKLIATPRYKMFHEDPQNFGTWDPVDYWRDSARVAQTALGQKGFEPVTRWDWSIADDDLTKPITIFGANPYASTGVGNPSKQLGSTLYYNADSGVYVWRNIAGDSTGCKDTITNRLFVTRLDLNYSLSLSLKDCESVVTFNDSTMLHDPCRWAMKDCNGNGNNFCDYINLWRIDWGDGSREVYIDRNSPNGAALTDRTIAHAYKQRGWFDITYIVRTNQGCFDTLKRKLFIPGPRPKFQFQLIAGQEANICVGETVDFKNLTDSFTISSTWNWFFGDGEFQSVANNNNVIHQYNKPGRFFVTLQQFDSVKLLPFVQDVCPVTYPDTPNQPGFFVNVYPRDSFEGRVQHNIICSGDLNTFYADADTAFKSFRWKVIDPTGTEIGEYTTAIDSIVNPVNFVKTGTWNVILNADYDPTRPKPWCTSPPDTLTFVVDEINADFTIDSSNKPDFCFTNTTSPDGVQYQWGYLHKSDITVTGEDFKQDIAVTNKDVLCYKFDTGKFYVCLIATNAAGCKDTICKQVINDYYKKLLLANIFTPGNSDNLNDVFKVEIAGHLEFSIDIYNRWNERVFHSEDPNISWNGKVGNTGAEVPDGTYFYILNVKFKDEENSKSKPISGTVNVIRKK